MRKILLVMSILLLFMMPANAETVEQLEDDLGMEIESMSAEDLKVLILEIEDLEAVMFEEEHVPAMPSFKARCLEQLLNSGHEEWVLEYIFSYQMDIDNVEIESLVAMRDCLDELITELNAQAEANSSADAYSVSYEEIMSDISVFIVNTDCTYRSCELWEEGYYLIHVDLATPYTYESGLVSAIRYTIDFCRLAFYFADIHTLRFEFHQETRDRYGNVTDGSPIIWKLKKDTFNRMDTSYFYEYAYSNMKRFMDACDSAAVVAEYKQVAE